MPTCKFFKLLITRHSFFVHFNCIIVFRGSFQYLIQSICFTRHVSHIGWDPEGGFDVSKHLVVVIAPMSSDRSQINNHRNSRVVKK